MSGLWHDMDDLMLFRLREVLERTFDYPYLPFSHKAIYTLKKAETCLKEQATVLDMER